MISPSPPPSTSRVASHYDELDWFYRDTWGDHLHHGFWKDGTESAEEAIVNLQDEVTRLAEILPGARICDIGSGYGSAAIEWAIRHDAVVTGITVSRKQWKIAIRRATESATKGAHVNFVHGDWIKNDFESGHFSTVTSIECLSHIRDKAAFFQQAARVLKPGGILALTAWTSNSEKSRLLESICHGGRFAGLAREDELLRLAHDAGIEVESLEDIGPRVKKTWRIIVGRLLKRVFTRSEYRSFLWKQLRGDRRLLFVTFQVWFAFETGMLGYVLLKGRKPEIP